MTKLALAILLVGLVACGGDETEPAVDGGMMGAAPRCNPLTQVGCAAGQKCASRTLQATPVEISEIACVPDGARGEGEDCTEGPPGAIGYSDCAKGLECVSNICRKICDPQGGSPRCGSAFSCGRYNGLFETSDRTVAGVCDPKCDPLTQAQSSDGRAACGSPDPAVATFGCYTPDLVGFTCAGTPLAARGRTGRAPAFGPVSGGAFTNGCAPGYIPLLFEQTGSTTQICAGLCAPLKTDSANPANQFGSPSVPAKLHTAAAPAPGDGRCVVGKKGAPGLTQGENCRYAWFFNRSSTGVIEESPYNDTLGICYAPEKYTYDHDMNATTPPRPVPACQSLPPKGTASPGPDGTADQWGCYSRADAALAAGTPARRAAGDYRIGVRSGKAYRHLLPQ